eukprot:4343289-Pleurochrysis_carterae.AAC.2
MLSFLRSPLRSRPLSSCPTHCFTSARRCSLLPHLSLSRTTSQRQLTKLATRRIGCPAFRGAQQFLRQLDLRSHLDRHGGANHNKRQAKAKQTSSCQTTTNVSLDSQRCERL